MLTTQHTAGKPANRIGAAMVVHVRRQNCAETTQYAHANRMNTNAGDHRPTLDRRIGQARSHVARLPPEQPKFPPAAATPSGHPLTG
jgi:hypothetical protein